MFFFYAWARTKVYIVKHFEQEDFKRPTIYNIKHYEISSPIEYRSGGSSPPVFS